MHEHNRTHIDLEEKMNEVTQEVNEMTRAEYHWEKFKFFWLGIVVIVAHVLLSPIWLPFWTYNAIATVGIKYRIRVKVAGVRRRSPAAADALEKVFSQHI